MIESDEVVAVAYLDSVKLQFDLHELVLVRGPSGATLQAAWPAEIYRFQRRNAYRVRTLERSSPTAHLRHPALPDMLLPLRVIDVSIGGCALFVGHDVPPLEPGTRLASVRIELDADTRFETGLQLQHVTDIQPGQRGVRIGCEWATLPSRPNARCSATSTRRRSAGACCRWTERWPRAGSPASPWSRWWWPWPPWPCWP